MPILTRKSSQSIIIGGVEVVLLPVCGQRVKLGIIADENFKTRRTECREDLPSRRSVAASSATTRTSRNP